MAGFKNDEEDIGMEEEEEEEEDVSEVEDASEAEEEDEEEVVGEEVEPQEGEAIEDEPGEVEGLAAAPLTIAGIEMLKATQNAAAIASLMPDEDESEEEDDDDEFYLQKFDSELRDNFIVNQHPESKTHNYEEVKAMSRVSRDGRGIIIDPLHKTLPFLTKYEMTRVLGQRAKQLDSGAKAFVKVPLNVIDGYHIAKLELEQKKIPFIIKRPFPNGGIEYWHVSDLEVL
jgi:DNA-directed RNA polymerase subunit K/omega